MIGDVVALAGWMDQHSLGSGPIENIRVLKGGAQNIIVQFARDEREYVLRKPPIHKRDNSDATMLREARILKALSTTSVPHARFIALCEDVTVLGCIFYLMEPVDGFNPSSGLPPLHAGSPSVRHRIGTRAGRGHRGAGRP